jgi:hypothetical protein
LFESHGSRAADGRGHRFGIGMPERIQHAELYQFFKVLGEGAVATEKLAPRSADAFAVKRPAVEG